ncbi:MAG: alkaline phosphatase family protein [Pseudomonadota bacterium]|nr:alkaline phosphatase family protein [Pseudomonadota bacterium]
MQRKLFAVALAATFTGFTPLAAQADDTYKHVLLISVDGMHAVDFQNCVANGACPNLAALGHHGVNYTRTTTSRTSDSFPGLMAIVSGGTPKSVGAFYDVAYDRVLAPPTITTGNGVAGGSCSEGTANGTTTEYEEGIDLDQSLLNGGTKGAALADGGMAAIDPLKLPRDPFQHCAPVYPWNFVRTNTIFGVLHAAGRYTAWSDKHPAYSAVGGPSKHGENLDDYFSPEINSSVIGLPGVTTATGVDCSSVQDTLSDNSSWTNSFANIQCYDAIKVNAVVNQISGKDHSGARPAPVPAVFGMNFQAVSVGQKLIDKTKTPHLVGGYLDAKATPSTPLAGEFAFVDASIGKFVQALKQNGLLESTLVVVTAKHGQSPIDPARFVAQAKVGSTPADVLASCLPFSESPNNPTGIGPTQDDIALIWLDQSIKGCDTDSAVATLQANASQLAIGEIFHGESLTTMFNKPGLPADGGDARVPDIIVQPNIGHTYTGSSKKQAEHGGFAFDDTNVVLLVSNPDLHKRTVSAFVETTQVAPTVLKALGLDPQSLDAVRIEGTSVLPDLF